ncbi:translation machinery-associated protein 16-like [Sycon ciliatum]|uniref:translation machinery-associated protein 16-like n=1 Tax=Sycon ciliatum TaxID=27933 RepID=UPI0031F61A65
MPKAPKQKVSKKVVHPNSRKASQISRHEAHRDRVQKNKSKAAKGMQQLRTVLEWFHERCTAESYSQDDVCDLIEEYISRFDDELEEIRLASTLKGRQVRPHASREDALRMVREKELALLTTGGFDAPDLTDAKNLALFRAWDQKVDHIPTFKMRKFRRTQAPEPE